MGHQRSRAGFVGLSAAAAAFAAAAMLSAATPPTARADPFTDITTDVQDELGYAQTAFSDAATDFGLGTNAGWAGGLAELSIGTDDDLVGVPDILGVGTTDALTGETTDIPDLASDFNFADLPKSPPALSPTIPFPTTIATLTTADAQSFETLGSTLETDILALPPTDYADTALDNALSIADEYIVPSQILSIGDLISFGF
jgi:hypothetical protein